ncbi:hypothetical protein [Pseudoxanthomonas indica]|uniref:Uncharacterized protein n=1 Tax=Pseudoxanthomonas indica TaxID=428993 RepID=A0A1T5JF19_9GAMM|nr:hypothetical protein [Pseudoxanthomonas indica]GGD58225.1 hypothetical protein GCM10007235_33200 [Pseudoxanthomonas indica]SKC49832.1 hypothetical protein SAMN06296058_0741 [Pseudoxanthomonas indica]
MTDVQIGGCAFKLASSALELVQGGHGEWGISDIAPGEPAEGLAPIWDKCLGLLFESGCVLFVDLGDGVWRIVANLDISAEAGQATLRNIRTALAYAFASTNCMRVVSNCPAGAVSSVAAVGLYPYAERRIVGADGKALTDVQVSANLDEWLELFGPRLFHVEACRFDNAPKAVRALTRWALRYGEDPMDVSDSGNGFGVDQMVADARERATSADFEWKEGTVQWLEHVPDCPWSERGICRCEPRVGFSNGAEVLYVHPSGAVEKRVVS